MKIKINFSSYTPDHCFMSAAISFSDHVDAVDCTDCLIAVGLSSLEGNIWGGGVQLLSLTSGEVVQSMKRNTGVASIHFVGDEKNVIVAAGDDGSISLHKTEDISDAQIVANAHNDCVSSICSDTFTPSLFTTAGWDGAIKIWDIYSNDLLKPVLSLEDAHQRPINGLAMGKTGAAANNLFASVGQDGFLRLWDQRMGLKNGCAQIHNVMQAVSCVEWDNFEGHQVYVGTDSGQIGCYDIRQANQSWTALQRIHKGRVRRIRSAKSVPGVVFSASDDATIAVSDTSSLLFQDANITHTSSSSNSTSGQAGISSLARLRVHTDYVTDLSLIEVSAPTSGADMEDTPDIRDLSAAAQYGDCSLLSASTDKSIRLTPFSFLDMTFA